MWLLDANVDAHLVGVLDGFGIGCEAAVRRGWGSLSNGELVSASAEAGFTCVLTHDRLFAESASQTLALFPRFSIVVIYLPQRPWREYLEEFRAAWEKQPIVPVPGAVVHWPAEQP